MITVNLLINPAGGLFISGTSEGGGGDLLEGWLIILELSKELNFMI